MRSMTPRPTQTFHPGPALRPAAALLDWLTQHGDPTAPTRAVFKLPVWLSFEDDLRLALGPAHVGLDGDADGALAVALDDGALATSLHDTALALFPRPASGGAVWVVGHLGPLVDIPGFTDPDRPTLAVLRVLGAASPSDDARAYLAAP